MFIFPFFSSLSMHRIPFSYVGVCLRFFFLFTNYLLDANRIRVFRCVCVWLFFSFLLHNFGSGSWIYGKLFIICYALYACAKKSGILVTCISHVLTHHALYCMVFVLLLLLVEASACMCVFVWPDRKNRIEKIMVIQFYKCSLQTIHFYVYFHSKGEIRSFCSLLSVSFSHPFLSLVDR